MYVSKKKKESKIPQSKIVDRRHYYPTKHPHIILAEKDNKYASVGLTTSPTSKSKYIAFNSNRSKNNKINFVSKTVNVKRKNLYSKNKKVMVFNDSDDIKALVYLENKAKKKLLSSK